MEEKETKKQEILDAFHFRHATKRFKSEKKISEDDFQLILEAGRLSPSSIGFEPWVFLIVQNMALREKLREVSWGAQGQLPTASHFVVILARTDVRYNSEYVVDHMINVKKCRKKSFKMLKHGIKAFKSPTCPCSIMIVPYMIGLAGKPI